MTLVWTVLLLTLSNIFMTFAWYGHLKWPEIKSGPLWIAIGVNFDTHFRSIAWRCVVAGSASIIPPSRNC